MRSALPSILTSDDLPWPELQAIRLDGEVWALGDVMVPLDVEVGVELRAASLRSVLCGRMIVELETAAWVWGAMPFPPERPRLCVRTSARTSRAHGSPAAVREVVIDDGDVTTVAGVEVCTPLRTAVDLARSVPEWTQAHADVLTRLSETGRFTLADAVRSIEARRNLPNKRRASRRLGSALSA